jgi:hypothetical protein
MPNILFCNIAWMKYYKGVRGDPPKGGGSYVDENGSGSEDHNFDYKNDIVRGFVQVTGSINLNRFGASKDVEELNDVTVIWTAKSPFGTVIVGWYFHATILKKAKTYHSRYYNIIADPINCHLLPEGKRDFEIPRGENGMGRSNVWYAKNQPTKFFNKIETYLNSGGNSIKKKKQKHPNGGSWGRNSDPLKRKQIEDMAILAISEYYASQGYYIESFEKDNLGWDLQAHIDSKNFLRLEVKGLSGRSICVEVTPNEYCNMNRYKKNYQLCVVTSTLVNPKISVFSFFPDEEVWKDENDNVLKVKELLGARMTII